MSPFLTGPSHFDTEIVLSQLTLEEKVALTAGKFRSQNLETDAKGL